MNVTRIIRILLLMISVISVNQPGECYCCIPDTISYPVLLRLGLAACNLQAEKLVCLMRVSKWKPCIETQYKKFEYQ